MAVAAVVDIPKETPAKAKRTTDAKFRAKVGRSIGRGVWLAGYKTEFPNATNEEKKAAWEEARKDFTKIGAKALKTIEKSGYVVTLKSDA